MVEAVPLTPAIAKPAASSVPTAPVPARPVSATIAAPVAVTGVYGTGYVNQLLVWGIIDDDQDPSWTGVTDTQDPNWTDIAA